MAAPFQDVIVLLPGILGSELARDGRVLWGWSGGVLMRNILSAGQRLQADLTVAADSPIAPSLDDRVWPTRLLPDLHLLPGLWKIDGYSAIQKYLFRTFGVREGENFFPFPYDWRRDNRSAAHRLRDEAESWLAAWRIQSGNQDAKLVLIAHSMGGLVSRYFLEVLEGWRHTRALITFGTPYSGSVNAIDSIVNGLNKAGIDLTGVARQLNSLYQLLPTYSCCDTGDGKLRRLVDANLSAIDPARLDNAAAFHDEIRRAAERNADDAEYRRSAYSLFPIVGYNQPTHHSVKLNGDRVDLFEVLREDHPGGDGTVPRQSAVPPRFSLPTAMFASTRHASLQNSPATLTHVGGVISSIYLRGELRGAEPELPVHVSLDMQDVYSLPERAVVRARPSSEGAELRVTFLDHSTQRQVMSGDMQPEHDGWLRYEFEPPKPGAYSVIVSGRQGVVEQARDVMEVLPAAVVWS